MVHREISPHNIYIDDRESHRLQSQQKGQQLQSEQKGLNTDPRHIDKAMDHLYSQQPSLGAAGFRVKLVNFQSAKQVGVGYVPLLEMTRGSYELAHASTENDLTKGASDLEHFVAHQISQHLRC